MAAILSVGRYRYELTDAHPDRIALSVRARSRSPSPVRTNDALGWVMRKRAALEEMSDRELLFLLKGTAEERLALVHTLNGREELQWAVIRAYRLDKTDSFKGQTEAELEAAFDESAKRARAAWANATLLGDQSQASLALWKLRQEIKKLNGNVFAALALLSLPQRSTEEDDVVIDLTVPDPMVAAKPNSDPASILRVVMWMSDRQTLPTLSVAEILATIPVSAATRIRTLAPVTKEALIALALDTEEKKLWEADEAQKKEMPKKYKRVYPGALSTVVIAQAKNSAGPERVAQVEAERAAVRASWNEVTLANVELANLFGILKRFQTADQIVQLLSSDEVKRELADLPLGGDFLQTAWYVAFDLVGNTKRLFSAAQ